MSASTVSPMKTKSSSSLSPSSSTSEREALIEKILIQDPVDVKALRELSRLEGGFLSNDLRRRVWPKLLDVNRYRVCDFRMYLDPHRDVNQVRCDVERSLWNIHSIRNGWDDSMLERRRQALSNIIMALLCKNKRLHYFQGLHCIITVFLLVFEEDHLAFAATDVVTSLFFSDCMREDFDVISKSMQAIMLIIELADKPLWDHLTQAEIEPFFATSWMITWFAHDIKKLDSVARVYDAMLCSPPVFSLYICAALVIHFREQILACDCDFATLHNFLVHIPGKFGIPFEQVLHIADNLMIKLPSKGLKNSAKNALKEYLESNKISAFQNSQSENENSVVPADWVLLKNMAMVPVRSSGLTSKSEWGWKRSLYINLNLPTNSQSTGRSSGQSSSTSPDSTSKTNISNNNTNSMSIVKAVENMPLVSVICLSFFAGSLLRLIVMGDPA